MKTRTEQLLMIILRLGAQVSVTWARPLRNMADAGSTSTSVFPHVSPFSSFRVHLPSTSRRPGPYNLPGRMMNLDADAPGAGHPSGPSTSSFQCGTCGKGFNRMDHLGRHVRSHNKERPFTCQKCSKSFGRMCVE